MSAFRYRVPWLLAFASACLPEVFSQDSCAGVACSTDDSQDVNVLLQRDVVGKKKDRKHRSHNHNRDIRRDDGTSLLGMATSALESIVRGTMSKSDTEIVLAQFNEDIGWSDAYASIRTIYCKGDSLSQRPEGCIPLRNVGREGHTYLYHIVKNYDKLSKWTVFSQAQSPSEGYKGHRRGGGHMLPGVPFDAYVLQEDAGGLSRDDGSAFVFTGALHKPTLNHSLRLSFTHAKLDPVLHHQSKCPTTAMLDGWQKWWDLGWFKEYIGGKCGIKSTDVPQFFTDYWDKYIQLPPPQDDIVFFSQGARFAASRERIHERPKEFYQRLLALLSKHEDPCHNYFNEWIWYYIVGKPTTSPCSPSLVTAEASRSHTMSQTELLESYRSMLQEQSEASDSEEMDEYNDKFVADNEKHEDDYSDKFVADEPTLSQP